ncbi:MAG TPA: CDP-alcohol phosphatidyltransferase family protein [Bryobacteraceae bacterium]|nr:CDP-alcohol phosphatidyltransferase family protein [Bryobacteraceae bacterium]
MQVVMAIPEFPVHPTIFEVLGILEVPDVAPHYLLQPVCGVPLLTRVLATAVKAGADSVLLIWPSSVPPYVREQALRSDLMRRLQFVILASEEAFDPTNSLNWEQLRELLLTEFLWLPWNWVTAKQCLAGLERVPLNLADWSRPALIDRNETTGGEISPAHSSRSPDGIAVISPETARQAERFLVARSGKVLDGIHTGFNRYLCRPVVRWISHTRVTPNEVSFAGLLVAILSCWAFAQGTYWWYVLGALLFFMAGLFDEMDGMVARIKFADSPFGTWLEGFIDGVSYLLLFTGIAVGLYRQNHGSELFVGPALLLGAVLTLGVTSFMRTRAAPADRPHEYLGNFYKRLEKDSTNWISRVVRQIQAFMKRGVMIHYVVIFTLLHGLQVFFYISAVSSHLTWILALYFNRRFFRNPYQSASLPNTTKGLEAQ